jgi:2-polyprenyl-3-methyl-5-hydroxy-6-metoxy-1,4-benzoquinol methylase
MDNVIAGHQIADQRMSSVVPSEDNHRIAWPREQDLDALFRTHHGDPSRHGWRVKMRCRFGYFSPDEWYEAVVDRLVAPGCRWIDVGGGKSIFPENEKLSRALAARCGLLVGVDPSENIHENELVHRHVRSAIEEYRPGETFDLATFRMVAEHVEHPRHVIDALGRLLRPGGHAVIYTPNRWSPGALAASLVPGRWHDLFARALDTRGKEDVFPTFYRMNTRGRLRALFEEGGFAEAGFAHLANCRTFQRLRIGCFMELSAWRLLRGVRVGYPENDLLGVYRRLGTNQ